MGKNAVNIKQATIIVSNLNKIAQGLFSAVGLFPRFNSAVVELDVT
jgi:hypothetical protein